MKSNGKAKTVNPAERMMESKKKLVTRLRNDITKVRKEAEQQVEKIEFRIRQAQVILTALEKGTLKA